KAPHIARALDSVLAQTYRPAEIIVVNDGSTDGGEEVVASYVVKYGVKLINQKNAGAAAARNVGVSAATAQFVAFLDADDYWFPDHLRELKSLIDSFPDAGLFSTAHVIERGGEIFRPQGLYQDGWAGLVDDFFRAYSFGLCLVNSITACVRKDAIRFVGGFPVGMRRGEDIVCWIKIALSYPVAHSEVVTAVNCQDAVNRTDRLREVEPPGSLKFISGLLLEGDIDERKKRGLIRLFDQIAFYTAAGFRANKDLSGVRSIIGLAWVTKRYVVASNIVVLLIVPSWLLRLAKRFRHPRVKNSAVREVGSR
ncbi:MAG: glycosyltransferase family 2 protein, partial [Methylophilaceae bacterium]|nr:glycosyltransferase family 2 protein [Methylophilaceae bacterium]